MSSTMSQPNHQAKTPQMALMGMITGFRTSQAIYVAAKLGVADHLADGPKTPAELAEGTGATERGLYRLLRALATFGIFAEDQEGRFHLTPLAECLRSNVPGSMCAMAIMQGEDYHWESWGDLLGSVQTGEVAFAKKFGGSVFHYLQGHPEQSAIFNQVMLNVTRMQEAAIRYGYDFTVYNQLIDVGGNHGSLLASILQAHPEGNGILFDLPHVVQIAQNTLTAAGFAERCQIVGGNFFEEVPQGGDAYLLKAVIHDWADAQALQILKNVRRAIPEGGRVLLIEQVIPTGNDFALVKWMDLQMMVMSGGLERTEEQFRHLLQEAGFELLRIVPTASEMAILEARPI